jgi:hypothetical protein
MGQRDREGQWDGVFVPKIMSKKCTQKYLQNNAIIIIIFKVDTKRITKDKILIKKRKKLQFFSNN